MRIILIILLLCMSHTLDADISKEVQAALDWQLPINSCKKPKAVGHLRTSIINGGYMTHSRSNTTEKGGGILLVHDVDHYTIGRYQRQKKRYQSCVRKYKSALLVSFESLKASAQYGLTEPQARHILQKLAQVQSTILSPEGVL